MVARLLGELQQFSIYFFADDCFIYFRENEHETRVVKQILG